MTQDFEARRLDTAAQKSKSSEGRAPGLWPAAAVAVLSGFICWQWLIPALATARPAEPRADTAISELASVDDQDITDALTTMAGSPAFLTRFKERASGCPRPLAWVSIAREPGQPAGAVRLRSGDYFSPLFQLSEVPVRVAIPYPGPYERGTGTLMVVGAGGHAAIALLPVWHTSVQSSGATRNVTWHPIKRCAQSNG